MSTLPTLRELHAAILADLERRFCQSSPANRIETVALYDPFPENDDQNARPLLTPAILIDMEAIDPEPEDGTERQPLRLTFAAHIILSFRTPNVQMELRVLAAIFMDYVRQQRWSYPGAVAYPDPASLSAQPGEFKLEGKSGLAGFDSFLVRWEQVVQLGEDTWNTAGITPTTVYLGIAPEIGSKHSADYQQIIPEEAA